MAPLSLMHRLPLAMSHQVPHKDFKLRHSVDIGMLAEAPLRPADHEETSLSDFILSNCALRY